MCLNLILRNKSDKSVRDLSTQNGKFKTQYLKCIFRQIFMKSVWENFLHVLCHGLNQNFHHKKRFLFGLKSGCWPDRIFPHHKIDRKCIDCFLFLFQKLDVGLLQNVFNSNYMIYDQALMQNQFIFDKTIDGLEYFHPQTVISFIQLWVKLTCQRLVTITCFPFIFGIHIWRQRCSLSSSPFLPTLARAFPLCSILVSWSAKRDPFQERGR